VIRFNITFPYNIRHCKWFCHPSEKGLTRTYYEKQYFSMQTCFQLEKHNPCSAGQALQSWRCNKVLWFLWFCSVSRNNCGVNYLREAAAVCLYIFCNSKLIFILSAPLTVTKKQRTLHKRSYQPSCATNVHHFRNKPSFCK
jgi:hypothetical protein